MSTPSIEAPPVIPQVITQYGVTYELKKPAFECFHLQWNCFGVQCDWDLRNTHICRNLCVILWYILLLFSLSGFLLTWPIYLIVNTQVLVNECRELDGQPRQDCLLENGVAARYALGFVLLFGMAFLEFSLLGGLNVVDYSPRKCKDCSPNYGCFLAIWDVCWTIVYFALLFIVIFCGTFLGCGNDCSGNKGFIAGVVLASVALALWSWPILHLLCADKENKLRWIRYEANYARDKNNERRLEVLEYAEHKVNDGKQRALCLCCCV